jgi:hypothetical protein
MLAARQPWPCWAGVVAVGWPVVVAVLGGGDGRALAGGRAARQRARAIDMS